ncbi:MAG: hypothetical protein M1813_002774 [Trichoglossum hirsutum]|nr:MAG: hypothetical protein M1813_002774 [Trichoglossum hirsutum]
MSWVEDGSSPIELHEYAAYLSNYLEEMLVKATILCTIIIHKIKSTRDHHTVSQALTTIKKQPQPQFNRL